MQLQILTEMMRDDKSENVRNRNHHCRRPTRSYYVLLTTDYILLSTHLLLATYHCYLPLAMPRQN